MKTGDLVHSVWHNMFVDDLAGTGQYVDGSGPFIYVSDLNEHQAIILLPDGRLAIARRSSLIGFK